MDLERTPLNSLDEGKRRKAQKGAKRAKKGAKRKGRKWTNTQKRNQSIKAHANRYVLSRKQRQPKTQRLRNKTHLANKRANKSTDKLGGVGSLSATALSNKRINRSRKSAGTGRYSSWNRKKRRADAPDFATRVEMYEELVNYLQECRANS